MSVVYCERISGTMEPAEGFWIRNVQIIANQNANPSPCLQSEKQRGLNQVKARWLDERGENIDLSGALEAWLDSRPEGIVGMPGGQVQPR